MALPGGGALATAELDRVGPETDQLVAAGADRPLERSLGFGEDAFAVDEAAAALAWNRTVGFFRTHLASG